MKYPQIVTKARFEAIESGVPQIVYECRPDNKTQYGYSSRNEFERTLALGKFPMIRLLLVMPNGVVVQ